MILPTMVTVTAEDLECRDILNDVGICFMDDMDALEASLSKGIEYMRPSPVWPRPSAAAPVSPDPTCQILPHHTFEALDLLSECHTEQFALPSFTKYSGAVPSPLPDPEISGRTLIAAETNNNCIQSSVMMMKKGRKRKHSVHDNESGESINEQEELDRRQRNREHAKRSRFRKKILTNNLLQVVEDLRDDTEKLREELYDAIGEEKVLSILNAKKLVEQEKFLIGIKDPSNRVCDAPTRRFLTSLRKKLPKGG